MKQIEKIIINAPKPSDFGLNIRNLKKDEDRFAELKMIQEKANSLEIQIDKIKSWPTKHRVGGSDDFLYVCFFGCFVLSVVIGVILSILLFFLLVILYLFFEGNKDKRHLKEHEERLELASKKATEEHQEFLKQHQNELKELEIVTKKIHEQKIKYDRYCSSYMEYAKETLSNYKQNYLHNVRSNTSYFHYYLDIFEDLVIFFKNTEPYKLSYWNSSISEFEKYISKRREGYKRTNPHQSFQNLIPKESNQQVERGSVQGKSLATNQIPELGKNLNKDVTFVEAPELKVQNSAQPVIRKPSNETTYHNDVSDTRKQDIGLRGELLVLEAEKTDLVTQGKSELAKKVEHVSRQGDGHGYDILSYFPNGMKKYVEVKSTTSGSHTSIVLTRNEIGVLKRKKEQAFVYLVEGVETEHPRIKVCPGDMFLNTDKYLVTKYSAKLK